jgi:hypothetical protein
MLHVVWNTVIQIGFDLAAVGEGRALWIGESGIFTVLVLTAVAVAYRARRPRRDPLPAEATMPLEADRTEPASASMR